MRPQRNANGTLDPYKVSFVDDSRTESGHMGWFYDGLRSQGRSARNAKKISRMVQVVLSGPELIEVMSDETLVFRIAT